MTTAIATPLSTIEIDHAGCRLAARHRVSHDRAGSAADARCILLIHGLGWDGSLFDALAADTLSEDRLIVPDLRGHGASSCAPGAFGISDLAADMSALLNHFGVQSCAVLGFSLGAAVALELARAEPDRITGLVLVAGGAASTAAGNAAVDAMLVRVTRDGAVAFAQEQAGMIWRSEWAKDHPDAVQTFIERRSAMDQDALHRTFRSARSWDRDRAIAAALKLPVRVIAADQDPFMSEADAKSMAAEVGAPAPTILAPSGHMLPLELPQAFNEAVSEAFGEIATARQGVDA